MVLMYKSFALAKKNFVRIAKRLRSQNFVSYDSGSVQEKGNIATIEYFFGLSSFCLSWMNFKL